MNLERAGCCYIYRIGGNYTALDVKSASNQEHAEIRDRKKSLIKNQ